MQIIKLLVKQGTLMFDKYSMLGKRHLFYYTFDFVLSIMDVTIEVNEEGL